MDIVSCKPTITRQDLEGVLDCLVNDELVKGNSVKVFENALSELSGYRHCTAVSSHTAAYHCAFKALEIGPDSEVIIPSYFPMAPMNALSITGGKAVIIDNADGSLVPDIDTIKSKVTEKTKAIVFGHITGIVNSADELKELGIPLVEDISHYIGLEGVEKGVTNATISIAAFTPFDLITTGNGAAVFTNSTRNLALFKEMRSSNEKLHCDYSITDFQAAMGIAQISRLQDFIRRRREVAKVYYDALRQTPHNALYAYNDAFTYQSFPLIFDAPKDKVEKYWKKSGIEIYHPVEQPLHAILEEKGMDFPNSDRYSKKVYSLPIYPTLSRKEIEKIARHLAKFI
ncbi:MAG TPA: DegT/DnrJ/EryC1/StrS aminotransferase family protein [Spirochaetota bacterium]